jgi:hypothetical protein
VETKIIIPCKCRSCTIGFEPIRRGAVPRWGAFFIDLPLNISYPHPMKHKDDIYFYFAFVICIGFTIILLSLGAMDSRNKKLQTQIDELRILFNQKFLQEMVVNKPTIRFEF